MTDTRLGIIRNAAKCLLCGDTIESKHRHDFVWCSCSNIAVDGGHDYIKISMKGSPETYEILCEWNEKYSIETRLEKD